MKDTFSIIAIIAIAASALLGGIISLWWFQPSGADGELSTGLPEAVILVNAFHWGWVPEVLDAGPGVRVEIAPGAQGSQIFVPKDTNLTIIMRNAGGNSELHEAFESRFQEFFMGKYGDAWMSMHDAGHDESEELMEDMHDDAEDEDAHMEEEAAPDPMLNHSFFLETYGLNIMLQQDPESNLEMVRLVTDRTGEFRFLCTNFCGLGHGDMQGVLVVE